MKNLLLIASFALFSLPTLASEYECHSIDNQIKAYLVFDDGPGGLDAANISVYGQNYSDVVFEENSKVQVISDGDSSNGKFEYGGDNLELGFSTAKGLKLNLVLDRLVGHVFDGTITVTTKRGRTQDLAFTCLEK